jgi:hypothetical protein
MIKAGCRWFTLNESKNHWGESYKGKREIGDSYLKAIEAFENQVKGV